MQFDEVRRLALGLPGVEEGTCYGTPAFKVKGLLFARLREEGDVLVVRVDKKERAALIRARPELLFVTPHYQDHPWMLVRLDVVDAQSMRELLVDAWQLRAPAALVGGPAPKRPAPKQRAPKRPAAKRSAARRSRKRRPA